MTNIEKFYEQNDDKFLPLFEKDLEDPFFPYFKKLVDEETERYLIEEEESIPTLLFGNSGLNNGFCIATGQHFVWFNAESPQDAWEFAQRITSFEPI